MNASVCLKMAPLKISTVWLLAAGVIWATTLSVALAADLRERAPKLSQTAGQVATDHPSADATTIVSPGTAGMWIYVNPETGEVEAPPPTMALFPLSQAEKNAMSTSDDGLVEEPSSVTGGGVMVNLEGRFRSPLAATRDGDGKITLRHLHAPLPETK